MFDRSVNPFAWSWSRVFLLSKRRGASLALALPMLLVAADATWPQTDSVPSAPVTASAVQAPDKQAVPDQPAPSADPAPAADPPQESPGILHEIGKLIDKSRSVLPPLTTPTEVLEGASDNISRLTTPSSMVTGRMSCPLSANGAPDCKAAAEKLCQSKGFKEGKSLNVDFAEKCSPKIYIPGHKREPGDCRADNNVTRALCQ